ncbi:MAG TPA: penicillin-binding protein [Candidatus Limnocylindrales bacterium]|nr:penicillin-binding protein [Candidatus Limnocylindrales bacterium]
MRSRNRFSLKLRVVAGICLLGGASIVGRMYDLTVRRGEELRATGEQEKCQDKVRMAYRGPVVDRNGVVLATTVAASMVSRESRYVYDPSHAPLMAPLLGQDVKALDKLLREGRGFKWISKGVDEDTATAIRNLNIKGIGIQASQERSYPQGATAAHIIGFAGRDSVGLEGIEKLFDTEIRGEPITAHVCMDIHGGVFLNTSEDTGMNRGATVHLTLDATLQSIAEAELNKQVAEHHATAGAVVMLDPKTGEILALANAPTFDPNDVDASPVSARRNRIVTDLFEPGSTMKPFVVAAAMDAGIIQFEDKFFCENGRFKVEGWHKPIRDHHAYGWLSTTDVIRVSSNICSAKIGMMLGPRRLYDYLVAFGFDRPTGIEMPGERKGLVLPPEKWRAIHTTTISFGQGISVTALQLATAYAAIANDGVRMQPRIVRKVTDQYGSVMKYFPLQEERRVVSAEVARQMRTMMSTVVSAQGTAARAQIEGVSAAGKTGTAQKAERGGYSADRWLASFAGFLPVEEPRAVIVVMIDEPKGTVHYGGLIAAPVFKAIAESSLDYLGIERELPAPTDELDKLFESGDEQIFEASSAPTSTIPQGSGRMPDVRGMPLRSAMRALADCNCEVRVEGHGFVVASEPAAGDALPPATPVSLKLSGTL